jgi:hypothetical protein
MSVENRRQYSCLPVKEVQQLTHVVQLARAGIHSLEQLIDLLIAHLLAQVRQNVAELSDSNKPGEFFIEYLETSAVLFGLAGVAEAAGAVEDALEVVEVDWIVARSVCVVLRAFSQRPGESILTVAAHLSLEVLDLRERRVLATCSEEITKVAERDTAVAALVEEGEGLLEVCALRLLVHGWLAVCGMSDSVLFVRTLCCLRARECARYCEILEDRRKKKSRLRGSGGVLLLTSARAILGSAPSLAVPVVTLGRAAAGSYWLYVPFLPMWSEGVVMGC